MPSHAPISGGTAGGGGGGGGFTPTAWTVDHYSIDLAAAGAIPPTSVLAALVANREYIIGVSEIGFAGPPAGAPTLNVVLAGGQASGFLLPPSTEIAPNDPGGAIGLGPGVFNTPYIEVIDSVRGPIPIVNCLFIKEGSLIGAVGNADLIGAVDSVPDAAIFIDPTASIIAPAGGVAKFRNGAAAAFDRAFMVISRAVS